MLIVILLASGLDVLNQNAVRASEVAVLSEKAVFPHDERDFELIDQHRGSAMARQRNDVNDESDSERTSEGASYEESSDSEVLQKEAESSQQHTFDADNEEKFEAPVDLETVIRQADHLFEQGSHERSREFLKDMLLTYPNEVEIV